MEKEVIKKEVKEQFNQLISAINNSDVLTWSEFYSKEEFLSTFVSTDFYTERGPFIDAIKYYFSTREYQHIEPLEVQVTALTTDLALMTSQEKIEMRLEKGENIKFKHVFTMIMEKRAGRMEDYTFS